MNMYFSHFFAHVHVHRNVCMNKYMFTYLVYVHVNFSLELLIIPFLGGGGVSNKEQVNLYILVGPVMSN